MLLFKFILLSSFFLSLSFFHGRSRFLCPDVTLYVHSSIIFSLYIICYVILSFSPIIFRYLFLFVILKFFLNLYDFIISLSVLRYAINFYPVISLSIVHYILSFSPISFLVFCVSICYSLFFFYVHYSIYYFNFSLYLSSIPFIFVLASKRNNHTDSEMDTLIVFHFVPLITRDQQ